MLWIGAAIIALTFVLFLSGLLMCFISGEYLLPFDKFSNILVSGPVPVIATAMGFAFVMSYTECDKHFSYFALQYVMRIRILLIPGTMIVIWLFSIALTSGAGLSAAIGPIVIPVLIRAGIHPAVAAGTFLAGTWGSYVSVASIHIAMIAKLSGTDIPSLVFLNLPSGLIGILACSAMLTLIAVARQEHKGYIAEESVSADGLNRLKEFKVNYVKTIMPLTPVTLLLLGSKQIGLLPALSVPQAMLICTILAFVATRPSPAEMTKRFYLGMGGFGLIISLMAAASVFTGGMEAVGLTNALIEGMKGSTDLAKIASQLDPLLSALCPGRAMRRHLPLVHSDGYAAVFLGAESTGQEAAAIKGAASLATLAIAKNGAVSIGQPRLLC